MLIEYRSGHAIFCVAFTCAQQGAVKSRDITRAQSSKKIRGGSITIAPRDTNREQKEKLYMAQKITQQIHKKITIDLEFEKSKLHY